MAGETTSEAEAKYYSALLIGSFLVREGGSCDIEQGSAYGAALLMPQVARSAGWPVYLTGLTVRAIAFLCVNMFLQYNMLALISVEENVMNHYAGQMNLCNYGVGSIGPMGTEVTPARTYSWNQWATRVFVKDSLKALFPHRTDDIDSTVDPGEYALESHKARYVCCFVFILATMGEAFLILNMAKLLWTVPTKAESWITSPNQSTGLASLEQTIEDLQDEDSDTEGENAWLDKVRIAVAGIPLSWKIVYLLLIWLPKLILWVLCCRIGVTFLMETAGIEDVIVNAVAMTFILNIDEMLCNTLMHESTKQMLSKCEEYVLFDVTAEANMTEQDIMKEFSEKQTWKHFRLKDVLDLLPMKLISALGLTTIFVLNYYYVRCDFNEDGQVVSKPMYLPTSPHLTLWQVLFPMTMPKEEEPFWTAPGSN